MDYLDDEQLPMDDDLELMNDPEDEDPEQEEPESARKHGQASVCFRIRPTSRW